MMWWFSNKGCHLYLVASALLLGTGNISADKTPFPRLSPPVDCDMQRICAIQKYVDRATGPGRRDYRCGALTTEEHDGTDIRLRRNSDMRSNIHVIAAAAGTVLRVRDGMVDEDVTSGRASIGDRLAGNAVVIDHGYGWETQYSHLKLHSLQVKPGQKIMAGDIIGYIGMSGNAEFPHLHFEVRYRGEVIDPFAWQVSNGCGKGMSSMWDDRALAMFPYKPVEIMSSGFADNIVAVQQSIKVITIPSEFSDPPALLFWVTAKGVRPSDIRHVRIMAPDGTVLVDRTSQIGTGGLDWYGYSGLKRPAGGWVKGRYRASLILKRKDKIVGSAESVITVK